ncbi:MAG: iron-sulfur cluster carrier protein ApbC [Bacteroidetes bacterium]|nr:iron-sulfur cluster carrier protein ApbC [Bacteroidota bacterium]
MKSLNQQNVLEALKIVKDPDLHKDIVTLQFVKNIIIDDNNLKLDIELTTPACPVKEELKAESEKAIRSTIEVNKIEINMTSNVTSRQVAARAPILPGVKNTIAVASGKGGVGKSTVAVNLAVALKNSGAKVGVVDCDIYGPSIPLMFDIKEKPQMHNQKLMPIEKYGIKVMSIGFLVDPMQAVIWRGPMASGAVKQFLTDVDWGELDYLIFDFPPGTGDIQLTIVQQIPLTGAVIVTTPQEISLADARKGLVMFNKVNVPILGIIENMSYYICSHCGERENIFDFGGGERAATQMKVPFLGEIPIDIKLRIGGDKGIPLTESDIESQQSKIISKIAHNLAAQISIKNAESMNATPISISL